MHRLKTIKGLIAHLKDSHKENIILQSTTFTNLDTFLQWKAVQEKENQTSFVQKCSSKKSKGKETTCNRAGKYEAKGEGKRSVKTQGSCKIGGQCTAHMKVCRSLTDGSVSVEYCYNHLHDIAIAHLVIPDNVSYTIAAKLQEGIPIDRILDDIRNTVEGQLGREYLINKQDIRNIKAQFEVEGMQNMLMIHKVLTSGLKNCSRIVTLIQCCYTRHKDLKLYMLDKSILTSSKSRILLWDCKPSFKWTCFRSLEMTRCALIQHIVQTTTASH